MKKYKVVLVERIEWTSIVHAVSEADAGREAMDWWQSSIGSFGSVSCGVVPHLIEEVISASELINRAAAIISGLEHTPDSRKAVEKLRQLAEELREDEK